MGTGVELIAAERQEQFSKHGYTADTDAYYGALFQMSKAASVLVTMTEDLAGDGSRNDMRIAGQREFLIVQGTPEGWNQIRWRKMMEKPYKERVIIAGALLAAEIDRLQNTPHPENSVV